MGNVFNLVEEYNLLMQEIEELGGEITPEIAEQLNIKEEELATKVRAYYYVIKTAEGQIQLAKDEQERLMAVRKSKEGLIKRLKKTVDLAVETFGTIKPKAAVKSLDLGDLKVWQKKSIALDITGEIDDERFCSKQVTFNLSYEDTKWLMEVLNSNIDDRIVKSAVITTIPNKEVLKDWLIEHEDSLKILKDQYDGYLQALGETAFTTESIDKLKMTDEDKKDLRIALVTQINRNSTVVFK